MLANLQHSSRIEYLNVNCSPQIRITMPSVETVCCEAVSSSSEALRPGYFRLLVPRALHVDVCEGFEADTSKQEMYGPPPIVQTALQRPSMPSTSTWTVRVPK